MVAFFDYVYLLSIYHTNRQSNRKAINRNGNEIVFWMMQNKHTHTWIDHLDDEQEFMVVVKSHTYTTHRGVYKSRNKLIKSNQIQSYALNHQI